MIGYGAAVKPADQLLYLHPGQTIATGRAVSVYFNAVRSG